MVVFKLFTLVMILTLLQVSQIFSQDEIKCPRHYNVLLYPRELTQISIINQFPLKIQTTFHIFQLNQTFSVSGLVCSDNFNRREAQTVCRTLGHTEAKFTKNSSVHEEEVCTFNHKDQHINVPCRFMLNKLRCSNTTIDLMQCSFDSVFNFDCKSEKYIDLTCTTPISTTRRTTTVKTTLETTTTTSEIVPTTETDFTAEV
ncbi:hypothetical protein I4U23_004175 [Adineta vaga]|nr:hypothetical protein I4U23_004175 [Adineta vaga]